MRRYSIKSSTKDGFGFFIHRCSESAGKTVPHSHDFIEIAFVSHGAATHHAGRQQYPIYPGDVFVILPEQAHWYTGSKDLEIWYVNIGGSMLTKYLPRLHKVPGVQEFFAVEPMFRSETRFAHRLHLDAEAQREYEATIRAMAAEMESRRSGYQLVVEALVLQLMVNLGRRYHGFMRATDIIEEVDYQRQAVEKVILFIEQNFAEDISLGDLAHCGCLHPQYFCRVFKKIMGMTTTEYVNRFRIDRASNLLRSTQKSIIDVAADVGFNDLSYFTRTFRKMIGVPPAKYRRRPNV